MSRILRVASALLLVGLAASSAVAQSSSTRRDTQGPVTVTVTALPMTHDGPLRIRVALDTHSVALDAIKLDQAVALRQSGGDRAPSAVEAVKGGGHHREGVVVFADAGHATQAAIVIKGVGGVAERVVTVDVAGH